MSTQNSTQTVPYNQDQRFAELEDLVAALEATWCQRAVADPTEE